MIVSIRLASGHCTGQRSNSKSPRMSLPLLVLLQNSVPPVLCRPQGFLNMFMWFAVHSNPSKYTDTLRDSTKLVENGGATVGISKFADRRNGILERFQELHKDRTAHIRLLRFRRNENELSLPSKCSQNTGCLYSCQFLCSV